MLHKTKEVGKKKKKDDTILVSERERGRKSIYKTK